MWVFLGITAVCHLCPVGSVDGCVEGEQVLWDAERFLVSLQSISLCLQSLPGFQKAFLPNSW